MVLAFSRQQGLDGARRDVVTISNQFVVHVLQCHGRVGNVWLVVREVRHPVKGVGKNRCPSLCSCLSLVIAGTRVAQGYLDSPADSVAYEGWRSWTFWGKRDLLQHPL